MEYLENVLVFSLKQDLVYLYRSLAEEWLLFCVFNKKSKFFVVKESSGFRNRELLKKYHESFSILIFQL